MKYLLLLSLLFTSCDIILTTEKELEKVIYEVAEKSYFDGQKDALENDIRIKLNSDSIYVWIKSPWDTGKEPIFHPTYLHTKKP